MLGREAGCLKSFEAHSSRDVGGRTDGFGIHGLSQTVLPPWGTGIGTTLGKLKASAAKP